MRLLWFSSVVLGLAAALALPPSLENQLIRSPTVLDEGASSPGLAQSITKSAPITDSHERLDTKLSAEGPSSQNGKQSSKADPPRGASAEGGTKIGAAGDGSSGRFPPKRGKPHRLDDPHNRDRSCQMCIRGCLRSSGYDELSCAEICQKHLISTGFPFDCLEPYRKSHVAQRTADGKKAESSFKCHGSGLAEGFGRGLRGLDPGAAATGLLGGVGAAGLYWLQKLRDAVPAY